ncbi:hypothetical protein DXT99_22835 [Pontibacter diazotrophicus]|uniref:Transposase n=1 Tax=Pontibacter diazotrophicus TaxID=1400979 RepID=A0A3D8L3H1_9BACT|nr:transposase [Pontibacter diazotrophicus]RDV11971.1 hypothetical protein DXT99_22835 [Pontibacter diazotrophicus]
MERRVFDASFKRMAIDLSYARGSVKEVADELGIYSGRLSKWRQKDSLTVRSAEGLTEEQREIKRLKEAQLERDGPDADARLRVKKGGEHLLLGRRRIYGFIKEHRNQFPA